MTLLEMFHNHTGLYTEKFPHHLEIYDSFFAPFRDKNIGLLEIGIRDGGSLQLWRKYFGERARIYGIDIQDKTGVKDEVDAEIFLGDQGDSEFLMKVVSKMEPLHIVIDDGSHISKDQKESFEWIFPRLAEGGLYIVEDIHTSYRQEYNEETAISFVEYLKVMIDSLHRNEHPDQIFFDQWDYAFSIHIYPSLAIIEKRSRMTWGGPTIRGTHAF